MGTAVVLSNRWMRQDKPAACPLTQREWEVMSGLAMNRNIVHIARVCQVTTSTVRSQVSTASKRLGVHGQAAAVRRVRQGWHRPKPAGKKEPQTTPAMRAYALAFDKLLANWRDGALVRKQKLEMTLLLSAERVRRDVELQTDEGRGVRKGLRDELDHSFLPGL